MEAAQTDRPHLPRSGPTSSRRRWNGGGAGPRLGRGAARTSVTRDNNPETRGRLGEKHLQSTDPGHGRPAPWGLLGEAKAQLVSALTVLRAAPLTIFLVNGTVASCRTSRSSKARRRPPLRWISPGPAARRVGRPGLRRRARRPRSALRAKKVNYHPQGARGARPGGACPRSAGTGASPSGLQASAVSYVVSPAAVSASAADPTPTPTTCRRPTWSPWPAGWCARSRPGAPGRRVRQAPADADHRHADRLPVGRRTCCLRGRTDRRGARPGRSLPPRRRAPAPTRRRRPPPS